MLAEEYGGLREPHSDKPVSQALSSFPIFFARRPDKNTCVPQDTMCFNGLDLAVVAILSGAFSLLVVGTRIAPRTSGMKFSRRVHRRVCSHKEISDDF
jgi:hypothetical protein